MKKMHCSTPWEQPSIPTWPTKGNEWKQIMNITRSSEATQNQKPKAPIELKEYTVDN